MRKSARSVSSVRSRSADVAGELVDQKRRALHVQRLVRRDRRRGRVLRQLERPRHERVVEDPLLAHPLDDGRPRFVQRQAGELAR